MADGSAPSIDSPGHYTFRKLRGLVHSGARPARYLGAFLLVAIVASPFSPPVSRSPLPVEAVPADSGRVAPAKSNQAVASPPLLFVENVGQDEAQGRFTVQAAGGTVRFAQDAIWVTLTEPLPPSLPDPEDPGALSGVHLRLTFSGANPEARLTGYLPQSTVVSYFQGADPSNWRSSVPTWGGIRYKELYPEIDLEITSEAGEWVWRLVDKSATTGFESWAAPGVYAAGFPLVAAQQAEDVSLRIEGAEGLALMGEQIEITTDVAQIELPLLELVDSAGDPLPSEGPGPVVTGDQIQDPFLPAEPAPAETPTAPIGARIGGGLASPRLAPALDPASPDDLVYATYLGGPSGGNWAFAVVVDALGAPYVAGFVLSTEFPTTPGAFQETSGGGFDGFVAKFNPDASQLEYATYLSGSDEDEVRGLAVDSAGAAYVVGRTGSADFPTSPGAMDTVLEDVDAFVTKLNPTGTGIEFSTFLGGEGWAVEGHGIAIDPTGAAFVTGLTTDNNFPTTAGAAQPAYGGGTFDGYVAKLAPDGTHLLYATYLGGSDNDCEVGGLEMECSIVIDGAGAAYIAGPTYSADFPISADAADTIHNGARDAFVVKLAPDTGALVYATFLGGSADECQRKCDLAIDRYGAAFVAGSTASTDFPVSDGSEPQGDWDGFLAKLDSVGSRWIFATTFGGADLDVVWSVAVSRAGEAFVAGETLSTDFPTTSAGASTCSSCPAHIDTFLTQFALDGSLSYGTYLGGDHDDAAYAMGLDGEDHVYLAGRVFSNDFPATPGAYQTARQGGENTFLARIDLPVVPPPVVDPSRSTVEVVPGILPVNSSPAIVTVTLLDENGTPVPGETVEVSTDGQQVNLTPAAAVSDPNGQAAFMLTSTRSQQLTITAHLAGGLALFDSATVTFVAGPTDAGRSTVVTDRASVVADGVDQATLTITLMDAFDNPIAGHTAQVLHNGAGVTVDNPNPVSDAAGRVVASVRSSIAQSVTFRARDVTQGVILVPTAGIQFVSTSPDLSTATLQPDTLAADGIESALLTVTLVDHLGAPIPGAQVTVQTSPATGVLVNGSPAGSGAVSIGTTDASGVVTAQIASTSSGVKTLTVRDPSAGVALTTRPQVTFLPGPPDAARSLVRASAGSAPADGSTPVTVVVTVQDAFGNRVPGATVELVASGAAVVTQPASPTDGLGQASGSVADATVESVTVRATADGVLVDESATTAFRGPDLALAISALASSNYDGDSDEFALAGGTIRYSLDIANEGLMPGEGVQLTDTLPAGFSFVTDLSGHNPVVNGQQLSWALGSLAVGENVVVEFSAAIASDALGVVTNSAVAATTGVDDDPADNTATLQTTVELPRPVMTLSPAGPTIDVDQGQTAVLTATVRNIGAGEMTGIVVDSPPTIPWVTVDAAGLTALAPRTEATFTVLVAPPGTQTPGLYRDFITGRDDYGNEQRIALTAHVFAPPPFARAVHRRRSGESRRRRHGATRSPRRVGHRDRGRCRDLP